MKKILSILLSTLALIGEPALVAALHAAFKKYPHLKKVFTEALLTFDTEDGGKTMDLKPGNN